MHNTCMQACVPMRIYDISNTATHIVERVVLLGRVLPGVLPLVRREVDRREQGRLERLDEAVDEQGDCGGDRVVIEAMIG